MACLLGQRGRTALRLRTQACLLIGQPGRIHAQRAQLPAHGRKRQALLIQRPAQLVAFGAQLPLGIEHFLGRLIRTAQLQAQLIGSLLIGIELLLDLSQLAEHGRVTLGLAGYRVQLHQGIRKAGGLGQRLFRGVAHFQHRLLQRFYALCATGLHYQPQCFLKCAIRCHQILPLRDNCSCRSSSSLR